MTAPLAKYQGAKPAAPDWFTRALAQAPERSTFDHRGGEIELLTWGEIGLPGLLFLHCDAANADWWSHIAPFFSKEYRCAAISWSGMGGSAWHERPYSYADWADEALAALDHAKLLESKAGPILIGHSLGGYPAMIAAARSSQIGGLVMIDNPYNPPSFVSPATLPIPKPHRLYATQADALARFHFMPPLRPGNDYLADHVARLGMKEVVEEDGARGWKWRFDPEIWRDMDVHRVSAETPPRTAQCPLAVIIGDESELIDKERAAFMRTHYPEGTPFIRVPDAGHHIPIDQPLALVTALRGLFEVWPKRGA